MLCTIILWVAERWGLMITESFRPQRHPNDLHGTDPVRALDLRYWFYSPELAHEIAEHINKRFIYDPSRPEMKVAIIHNTGSGMHFHIQVCNFTTYREEDR